MMKVLLVLPLALVALIGCAALGLVRGDVAMGAILSTLFLMGAISILIVRQQRPQPSGRMTAAPARDSKIQAVSV